jgi:hypothetical protein
MVPASFDFWLANLNREARLAGRERRLYALVACLPYPGAQTAFFSLEMTAPGVTAVESEIVVTPRSKDTGPNDRRPL